MITLYRLVIYSCQPALDIAGTIITIDAMGTQTEIAKQIIALKANYVLALKANHPTFYSGVKQWFETAIADNFLGIDVSYDKLS